MEVDTYKYEGTTRERFIKIIKDCNVNEQARIIRGVLKKYPVGSDPRRTQSLFDHFNSLANILEGGIGIKKPDLVITTEVLKRALDDAEALIRQSGAISAVDRIHTALHSYLLAVCNKQGIHYEADSSITQLFKLLREQHPALSNLGSGSEQIDKVLKACTVIVDALNPLRNRASIAHPNEQLLGNKEAMLVVNVTRTLLHYLDSKFASR